MKAILLLTLVLSALLIGCGSPNAANIQLRKENQDLRDRVAQLKRELAGRDATIRAFESRSTTVPTLPADRLAQLFTTHGLTIGRLTGEADLDAMHPGNEGLKVRVVPIDQYDQPIKAAGAFTVDAFDLAQPDHPQIGHWEFPAAKAQDYFQSFLMLYTYSLPCPWQTMPKHEQVTVRVKFEDTLTGRTFESQKVVRVNVAAASTQPSVSREW